jgi:hypothetical protein
VTKNVAVDVLPISVVQTSLYLISEPDHTDETCPALKFDDDTIE